jgi:PilZ domain
MDFPVLDYRFTQACKDPSWSSQEHVELGERGAAHDHGPRAEWRMSIMTERRTARRYDLSLPVIIRVPAERLPDSQKGKTRDISTRGLYFVLDQDLEAGSELDITLTLPAEITHGSEVFVRALGKVVRVERRMEDGSARMGVAAVIERYDIIRGENGRA